MKVLLADPNPTTRKVVELTLEGEEVELISTPSGGEALEKARGFLPHVILFSETLDDMGALEFHKRLKELPSLKDTPRIVLISGRGITPAQLQEEGIPLYLEKPFEAQELMDRIDEALQIEVVDRGAVTGEPEGAAPQRAEPEGETEEAGPSGEEESAEVHPAAREIGAEAEAPGEEEDFGVSLKALSDEVFQDSVEEADRETELEDEISATEEMSAQADGLNMDENLLMEIEEVPPQSMGITGTPPEPLGPLPGEGGASSQPGLESFGQALGLHLAEAAQRAIDESFERVMKECLEKTLEELRPGLLEIARKRLERFLPRMAEVIIRQEIEKLKASVREGDSADPDDQA